MLRTKELEVMSETQTPLGDGALEIIVGMLDGLKQGHTMTFDGHDILEVIKVQAENLHYLMSEAYKEKAAVERVRELHKPMNEKNEHGFVNIVCAGCFDEDTSTGEKFHHCYPCATIEAVRGEQS